MSQQQADSNTAQGQPSGGGAFTSVNKDCVILFGAAGPIMASANRSESTVMAADRHLITFKFPRGGVQWDFEEAPKSLIDRFPNAKGRDKGMTLVTACVGVPVTISGFGIPFDSPDPEVEGWINGNKPIIDGRTLLDLLSQEHFHLVVPLPVVETAKKYDEGRLPPPFAYPYGEDQVWNLDQFKREIGASKGHQFYGVFSHPDDTSHVTAVTQSIVQDVAWLDDAAKEIEGIKFPAYFVSPPASGDIASTTSFIAIVSVTKEFREQYDSAWRRLAKPGCLSMGLFGSYQDSRAPETWKAEILPYAKSSPALRDHRIGTYEVALSAMRPRDDDGKNQQPPCQIKTFPDRTAADSALEEVYQQRMVNAVNLFRPDALPSNVVGCGLPEGEEAGQLMDLTEKDQRLLDEVKDRMDLHRALLRGNGFYDWKAKPAPNARAMEEIPSLRPLPRINLLDTEDTAYIDDVVAEALPQDQSRFRQYLSNSPLGLGLITAGPGFGKTTAGAAAAFAMQAKLGKILCSAPTNVAIDTFAARLDGRTRAISDRYNTRLQGGQVRRRHKLVVRAYRPEQESIAFERLLQDPRIGDDAAPKVFGRKPSKWKLHLSCAFWLLVLLGSPAVRELHPDDSEALHEMQQAIREEEEDDDVALLRAVAASTITWEEFKTADGYIGAMNAANRLLTCIPDRADLLCTTAACTENVEQYRRWKNSLACGVAIDEVELCVSRSLARREPSSKLRQEARRLGNACPW
ncbi:hypothetical protein ACHAPT_011223 [Fusarium lateritium]